MIAEDRGSVSELGMATIHWCLWFSCAEYTTGARGGPYRPVSAELSRRATMYVGAHVGVYVTVRRMLQRCLTVLQSRKANFSAICRGRGFELGRTPMAG